MPDINQNPSIDKFMEISEIKYQDIIDSILDNIVEVDMKGNFTYISPQSYDLFGYRPNEVVGTNGFKVVHPDDLPKLTLAMKSAISTGETISAEYRALHKDGHYVYISARGKYLKDKNRVISVLRDISKQKEAEIKLQESEKKYREIIEKIEDGYFEVDLRGNYTFVNNYLANFLGNSKEEIIGRNFSDFVEKSTVGSIYDIFNRVYRDENLPKGVFETKSVRHDGVEIDVDGIFYLKYDSNGKKVGFYGFTRDITERKKAEDLLKESEEKFRSLFNITPASIVVSDLESNILLCNQKFCELHGIESPELAKGRKIPEFIAKKDRSKLSMAMKKTIEEKPRDFIQYTMLKEDGTEFLAEGISVGIRDKAGEMIGLIGVAQDITDRKIAEQKLRDSEEKYNILFQYSNDAILLHDFEGNILEVNDRALQLFRYSKEEFLTLKTQMLRTKKEQEIVERVNKEISQKGFVRFEIHFKKKSGEIFPADISSRAIDISGKKIIQAVIRDISERKLAERRLKESEVKFRTITEQSLMGVAILQDGKIKYANETFSKITEYSITEMINWSKNEYTKLFHPDDLTFALEQGIKKQSGDKDTIPNYKLKIVAKSGITKWIDNYSQSFFYENRYADLITIIDITEQEKTKYELKESEAKYRNLFENSPNPILLMNLKGDVLDCNSATEKMSGFTKNDLIGQNIIKFGRIPKEYIPTVLKNLKSLNNGETPEAQEFQLYNKENERVWLLYQVTLVRSRGETLILVTLQDINSIKKAEQKLRESEEKYRHLFEKAPLSITLLDFKGKIIDINLVQKELFGHDKSDLIGKNFRDLSIFPQDSLPLAIESFQSVLKGEEPRPIEIRVFDKKNIPVWMLLQLSITKINNEPILHVIGQNITHLKEAEQKLKELNTLKSEFLKRTSHELKTPLIAIKGFTDLILSLYRDQLIPEVISKLGEINHGCERLQNIINNLLKGSKLDSTDIKPKFKREDISFLIKYCVSELLHLAEVRNHTISLDIEDRLITRFEKEEIHDVISNLLSNAIKYTPPEGKIEIKSEIVNDYIIVSIKDNGIGFRDDEKEKIFQQFGKIERYGQGLDIDTDGTGLGLYISKRIVESHGGKIWMESEGKNKGSTFYFSLPLIKN